MKKEKLFRICKIVQRLTLLIGVLTIALPIVFWGKIPDPIPVHYGASGVADRYSDKSSLILIFLVVAILIGVMNIAIYCVKIGANSRYTTDSEKSQMEIAYPMIVFMNLVIQVMFAYIMLCCVTGRNLGILFFPIFLIAVFLPLILGICKMKKVAAIQVTALEKYKLTEKQEKGIVYRSKVDWWLGLLLLGTVGYMVVLAILPIVKGAGIKWVIIIPAIIVLLMVLPLFAIKYVLYSDHLCVSCGFYGKERIPYEAIDSVKETRNPISSAAMSLDRIQIDYTISGTHGMTLISPVRKKEFIRKVEEKSPCAFSPS